MEDAAAPRLEFRELGQRHASDGEDDDKRLNDVGHAGRHAGITDIANALPEFRNAV